jgi:hypothetical protein
VLASVLALCLVSAPDVSLSRTRVPAAGAQTSVLTVERFGRVSIVAKSKQGASVQLVDRVSGPGPTDGAPGDKDGRLDLFLDRGTYRIVARGAGSADTIELSAKSYLEKNGERPPMLVPLKSIEDSLHDFEQRSFWLEITRRQTISLEAAGRNLTDLRIFQDGVWLIDAIPKSLRAEPKPTQPLRVLQLTADLEPGLYLLSAYGGPTEAWAEDSSNHPFYLRWGVPSLPEAGRKRMVIGPLGYDRFLIDKADYFRIELVEALPLSMQVTAASPADLYATAGRAARIEKNTIPPVAELHAGYAHNAVTITGAAGQSYLLQWFPRSGRYSLSDPGTYYVASIDSGHAEDSLDSTAVVLPYRYADYRKAPTHRSVIELDDDKSWVRRFNLLQPATMFFYVSESGKYQVKGKGAATASFRFVPMWLDPPVEYRPPPYQTTPGTVELDTGYWILSLEPKQKGILEIEISRSSLRIPLLGDPSSTKRPLIGLRIPELHVSAGNGYWFWTNQKPGVVSGMIVRRLPLDLRQPLYAVQDPAEPLTYEFSVKEPGTLRAEAEDGSLLEISVDNKPSSTYARVESGEHRVTVFAKGTHLVPYSLSLTPRTLEKDSPLPKLPDSRFAALPDFPVLTPNKPYYFDLQRDSAKTFLLRAERPGFFRVESSGLLETSGRLRTRMTTRLDETTANGVGRNFLLEQYLGTGDYQIQVRTQGRTRGHLGLALGETHLIDAGALREGIAGRVTIPGGAAAIFPLEIKKSGTYRLRAFSPGRTLRARIEDDAGWPLVQPGLEADRELALEPGKYRLIVLPEAMETRALAIYTRPEEEPSFSGKGPHVLPLEVTIPHVWREKGRGENRRPDVFTFELPARGQIQISLDESMRAQLIRVSGEKKEYLAEISRGGWSGIAERGNYRLEIFCKHENDQVDYQVQVTPQPMMAGSTREVGIPASIPIAIGDGRSFEISSFGSSDVRARLYDASRRIVAENDDRPDDWNFLIATRAAPGDYLLVLDPVGKEEGETKISVRARADKEEKKTSLPYAQKLVLDDGVRLIPFDAPDAAMVMLASDSRETTGIALEAETSPGEWRTLASAVGRPARAEALLLSAGTSTQYRARVWSADRRSLPAAISIVAITPELLSEEQLAEGVELPRVPGTELGAAAVELTRPGIFSVFEASEKTRSASLNGDPFLALDRDRARAESLRLYFVRPVGREPEVLRAERLVLDAAPAAMEILRGRSLYAGIPLSTPERAVLVEARAIGSGVGASLGTKTRDLAQLALRENAAIAVSLDPPADALARFWALESLPGPLDIRASALSFDLNNGAALSTGLSYGTLSSRTGERRLLPPGPKTIRLTLEVGAVAVLATGGRVERVFWADGTEEVLETNASSLVLLNPLERPVRWSVELISTARLATPALSETRPVEMLRPIAGTVRLDVPQGPPKRRLRVRGNVESALYLSTAGEAQRGYDLELDERAGILYLRTGTGIAVVWLETPDDGGRGLFGASIQSAPALVSPGTSVALSGQVTPFQLVLAEPSILHLRTETPVVARTVRPGGEETTFHPQGAALDVFLPKGQSTIALRALLGGSLFGTATFTTSRIEELGEGLGPEVMLSPGTMRVFRFQLASKTTIGAGVRSDSDAVETVLMDSQGKMITRGIVHMTALEPGDYLLGLRAPENSAPARARAAIAGLSPPRPGPPLEIVQSYLQAE